jgi:hypothetical protein
LEFVDWDPAGLQIKRFDSTIKSSLGGLEAAETFLLELLVSIGRLDVDRRRMSGGSAKVELQLGYRDTAAHLLNQSVL